MLSAALSLVACGQGASSHVFAPPDSEFQVTFPVTPHVSEMTGQGGLALEPTKLTTAIHANQYVVLRADTSSITESALASLQGDRFIEYALSYAKNQGLTNAEATEMQKASARCVQLRGTKNVDGSPTTVLSRMCLGKHSLFSQYVLASATTFPPSGAMEFMESLEHR